MTVSSFEFRAAVVPGPPAGILQQFYHKNRANTTILDDSVSVEVKYPNPGINIPGEMGGFLYPV